MKATLSDPIGKSHTFDPIPPLQPHPTRPSKSLIPRNYHIKNNLTLKKWIDFLFLKTFHSFSLNIWTVKWLYNQAVWLMWAITIFTPWCQNSYRRAPIFTWLSYTMLYSQGLKPPPCSAGEIRVLRGPMGLIPIFFRSYQSSLYLQTFLLLDLWS